MTKRWLFSAQLDLALFGGTAAVALLLVALAPRGGAEPAWTWITSVLLVDVAHVWSTAFVVYLDPAEWKRRPLLYAGVPALCFIAGIGLFILGEAVFWTVVAYLATLR